MTAVVGTEAMNLAEVVAARLCHDLSGLAGTLMNTLEMAEEDGGGEALDVSVGAGRALAGRLRLLRAAWGGAGGEADAPALAELLSHAAGFPRTRTDWSGCAPGPFPPALARLLLNLALAGTEGMPRGGTVRVSGGPGGAVRLVLDGPGAAWPASWRDQGRNQGREAGQVVPVPAGPRDLQPALALVFAAAAGFELRLDGPDTLSLHPRA